MSNSKHLNGDNIIPFRLRDQKRTSQSKKYGLEQLVLSRKIKPISQAGPTPEQNKEYIRLLASKGNPTQELVDKSAPSIVRRIVKHVRKRSGPNNLLSNSLPRVLSRQLQLLCDFDHPAGTVLRDWLDGNLDALPDGFEKTYTHASKMKDIAHDQG